MGISRRFEGEAFYFEPSIAEKRDFDLPRYAKAFLWVALHPEITPNDGLPGIDHFRSRRCITPLQRSDLLGVKEEVDEVLDFFDGLRPDEYDERNGGSRQRRRWDRVVALHLFVLAFIGKCGYREHQTEVREAIQETVAMLLYPGQLYVQFTKWLPRLGLADSMTGVQAALLQAARETSAETEEQRAERVLAVVRSRRDSRRGVTRLSNADRDDPVVLGRAEALAS